MNHSPSRPKTCFLVLTISQGLQYISMWDASEETLFTLSSRLRLQVLDLSGCSNISSRVIEQLNGLRYLDISCIKANFDKKSLALLAQHNSATLQGTETTNLPPSRSVTDSIHGQSLIPCSLSRLEMGLSSWSLVVSTFFPSFPLPSEWAPHQESKVGFSIKSQSFDESRRWKYSRRCNNSFNIHKYTKSHLSRLGTCPPLLPFGSSCENLCFVRSMENGGHGDFFGPKFKLDL